MAGKAGALVGKAGGAAVGALATVGGAVAARAPEPVKQVVQERRDRLETMQAEWKQALEAWMKGKVLKLIRVVVDEVPSVIKSGLEDPEMPRCVSQGKDKAVDIAWPDIRMELMWEFAVLLDGEKPEHAADEREGVDCVRAFFRWHIYPYNKSLWGKLRDPVWVTFTLVSLIPLSGLCSVIFLLIFIIIDKTDAYQLSSFVLQFKGTQFITQGIIRAITGFFLFLSCVTAGGDDAEHSCEDSGPGTDALFEAAVGGYFLQVLLVWVSFILLCFSKDKGRTALKGSVDVEEEHDPSRTPGGYLRYLLFYDLLCFAISITFVVAAMAENPDNGYDHWTVQHAVFAAQVLYGFFSLPFFFFTIPFFQAVLTHTVPSGYDEQGRCRKIIVPPAEVEKRRSDVEPAAGGILDLADTNDLLERVRKIVLGEKLPPRAEEGGA